ncbi:cyclase family protein [Humibacter ginsenosidimutans]|uniref:Cyclase family protein n=1 Tax=Humibacter ginsenosidimutans TaxID=2599293 RepID=A0A5B8M9W3_9MICO|nr:cyclase family protein [Humibacter ginsenosidimutans]QDZ16210.1 cyclase family protein [Humibacter ginsenosidimutans]
MPEYRAHFDATVDFVNGGSLTAEGFRLDLPSAALDADAVGRLFVQHLGLALVGRVEVRGLHIVEEQHRGSRGIPAPVASDDDSAVGSASGPARRVVDLSHRIRAGLITYPGLPAPVITPHLTREQSRDHYAPGTEFGMDLITMIGNTGTYLDSPLHRYADGGDLASLDLSTLVDLRAEVVHVADAAERGVPASVFYDRDVRGAAVLVHTGWDRHFGTERYANGAPFLTPDAVGHLVDQGAVLVGIDSLNIDDTESGGERPAHSGLLAAGIHVVEHLTNLGELPARGARFTAAPPAIEGFGTITVRAFALV